MAPLEPPSRYVTLGQAIESPPGSLYNVIGVCVDYLPPARSRGKDYTIKFTLADPTWTFDLGMNFRFFNGDQDSLPAIANTGDVVLLRNVATKMFGSSPFGLSNHATIWYVIPGPSILESTCPRGTDIKYIRAPSKYNHEPLTLQELQYARALAMFIDPPRFKVPAKATNLQIESSMSDNTGTPLASKNKRRLLKELELDKNNSGRFADGQPAFADLFGEVRRVYTGGFSCADVYLTDYTHNSKLYSYEHSSQARDGDEYGYVTNAKSWQGPWGKMTIKVFLWDAHGMFVKAHVKERMYILIKNCHIRPDPNGSKLEAVCRGDRDNSSKVNVTIYDPITDAKDEHLQELLQRRNEYKRLALKQDLPFDLASEKEAKKRPADQSLKPEKMSKSKRKKLKKNAHREAKSGSSNLLNSNIRCNKIEIPITPIGKILDPELLKHKTQAGNEYSLPFHNAAYKCNVRVVDYYPEDVAEFAVPLRRIPAEQGLNERDDDDTPYIQRDVSFNAARGGLTGQRIKWEWRFVLIVEDATTNTSGPKARIPVLVTGQHGECLLKEDACDLEDHPDILARLQEKLFIMWGDLQEIKEANSTADGSLVEQHSSQRPFQCLIQEYGVTARADVDEADPNVQYKRLFQMFSTTILS